MFRVGPDDGADFLWGALFVHAGLERFAAGHLADGTGDFSYGLVHGFPYPFPLIGFVVPELHGKKESPQLFRPGASIELVQAPMF